MMRRTPVLSFCAAAVVARESSPGTDQGIPSPGAGGPLPAPGGLSSH